MGGGDQDKRAREGGRLDPLSPPHLAITGHIKTTGIILTLLRPAKRTNYKNYKNYSHL